MKLDIIQTSYLHKRIKQGKLSTNILESSSAFSKIASSNLNDPLFFWQLYSLTGEPPLRDIITRFYKRVFNDSEAQWFSSVFVETGNLDYHVENQLKFWIDLTGGPITYKGGEKKLNIKHRLVKEIMTQEGANRWLYHMDATLSETTFRGDPRILPCLIDFVNYFMDKYGLEFDFNFQKLQPVSKL